MIDNVVMKLMRCFSGSFLTDCGEIVVHSKANEYFNIQKCADELEVKCKVLEWFSRAAYKTAPYTQAKKNNEFHDFMRNGINSFLETNFTKEDMAKIYQELGNQVNRDLTIKFINSGYDMSVLIRT